MQVFILIISVDPLAVVSGMSVVFLQLALGTSGQAEQPGKLVENNSNLMVYSET